MCVIYRAAAKKRRHDWGKSPFCTMFCNCQTAFPSYDVHHVRQCPLRGWNLYGYGKNSEPSSMTPEQQARQQIDAQLVAAGWIVQDYKAFNPSAGRGIASREVPLKYRPL